MNKKIILGLSLVLVALFAIIGGTTLAWLTDTGNDSFTYTVGQVSYKVDGTEGSDVIVPGDSVIPAVTITNSSTVDTNIRVKVTGATTATGVTVSFGEYVENTKNTTNLFLVTKNSAWVLEGDYYYYGTSSTAPTKITSTTTSVTAPFDKVILNGWVAGNNFEGQTVTITLTFEVKQADNVTWAEMGSINFETGLTA